MTPAIRPVRETDIPAIAAIYDHAVRHGSASFELEPPDEAEMTKRMRALVEGGFPYFVAEVSGKIGGYAYAGLYRTRPGYRFTLEDSVYVAPDAHRRGIGRALLTRLVAEGEKLGYRKMIAVIGDSANASSIELHRACGFEFAGNLTNVGLKFGRWLDSVMMQRALGEGASTIPR